jgi:DNA polymerase type B, organellar and viral
MIKYSTLLFLNKKISQNVFNSFIKRYFDIKAGLSPINMDRTTAKMILNSLYGRLGMKPYKDLVEIVESSQAEDILTKFIVTNSTIPEDLIGKILGLFKLEQDVVKGYFISPKLYALKTIDGKIMVKAKGIGSKLDFNQFESLIQTKDII